MEEFPKEFRSLVGKPVPFQVLGLENYDTLGLAKLLPDIVKIAKLPNGDVFLQAIPDDKTSELADAIQNQEWRRDGFNYNTGNALRSSEDRNALANAMSEDCDKIRRVPLHIMDLLRQLIDEGEFPEEGLNFEDFKEFYDMEKGHSMEVTDFGFKNMEDFYLNGDFERLVEPRLQGWDWILLPCDINQQSQDSRGPDKYKEHLREIKENLLRVFREKAPYGCSLSKLVEHYGTMFGFNQTTFQSKDLLEACLLFPDVCSIDKYGFPNCDMTIVPANGGTKHPFNRPIFPLHKLCETKTRVKFFLDHIGEDVEFKKFVDGIEGYFGHMNLLELRCDNWLDVLKLMPDICSIEKKLQAKGGYVISLAKSGVAPLKINSPINRKSDTPLVPAQLITNLHKVLAESPDGIKHTEIYRKYLNVVGESLDLSKYETKSLSSLLRNLHGRFGFKFNGSVLRCSLKIVNLPPFDLKSILPCWVKLVEDHGEGTFKLKEVNSREAWSLEDQLEKFYVTDGYGVRLSEEDCVVGQMVVGVHQDARCYRARIDAVHEEGFVTVLFIDLGESALVPSLRLFQLDGQFAEFPQQVFTVHNVSSKSELAGKDYLFLSENDGQLLLSSSRLDTQVKATNAPRIETAVKALILKKISSKIVS